MVLKITAERDLEIKEPNTDAITVHVASTVDVTPTARIFTLVTYSDFVVAKWLKQVLKHGAVAKTTVLVGVAADTEITSDWYNPKKKEFPYQRLLLSAGSHALIYTGFEDVSAARAVVDFFQNPRVFAVGRDMANISRRLKVHHGIEIRNAVDLNELAAKGLRREDLDLRRYDLDGLAKAVLGKEMDVLREYDLENDWWSRWDLQYEYRKPKWFEEVKFSAVDVHLCFMIGLELIDAIDGAEGLKKKAKKKKNK